jgi:hypothetical protein
MRARIRREHDGLANAWNTFDFVEGNMPVMALFIVEYQGSLIYNFGLIHIVAHLIHIVAHCSQSSYFVGFSLPAWNVLTDSVTPWEADSLREMSREGPLMIWKLLDICPPPVSDLGHVLQVLNDILAVCVQRFFATRDDPPAVPLG